ncbi:aminotransferase class III [Candidatus Woesearchaeota archaeon B3_Woes]|nr:MAG: aminotransferase class III [Candidatus Woesearchaeota archaeon B3_Woes]
MKNKKGKLMWNKAKELIPGGTQLLSKRAERFLPDNWPSYYKKAKGVKVEDLDGNNYIDMSIMGIGSCVLGYSDDDVNNAVKKVIDEGSMCTLNSIEEVELAELLLKIHPWAQQVRYARTGGEAMAIAIRIARAASKKEKVAFCGYHGWQDWYLSSNLNNKKNLDGHLLPGLKPTGVPRGLLNTTIPFEYNKIEQLKKIVKNNDIGIIVIEPFRHQNPKNGFIEKVREIADKNNIVLIFDEISSGWRNNLGGIHLVYDVIPDIVVYAKAMSNGYPMATILGKKKVMDVAQDSFISSTYWTERIGPTAAIATIKKMKEKKVFDHISKIGNMIGEGWKKLAKKHNLDISVRGPNSLITFSFNYENANELRTLFTQEMLRNGFLASLCVYVSYSHKKEHVEKYLNSVDDVFGLIKCALEKNNVKNMLEGPIASDDFKRLT